MPVDFDLAIAWRRLRRVGRWFSGFRRDRRGSYAVEFALVALPFFSLLFATFDTAMIFFKEEYLQTAVSEAGRLVFTGQAQTAGYTQTQFKQAICGKLPVMIACSDVYVDVRTYPDFTTANRYNPVDNNGNFQAGSMQYDPGARSSIVVVTGYVQHSMFMSLISTFYANLSNGKILLTASAAFRNEPYGS